MHLVVKTSCPHCGNEQRCNFNVPDHPPLRPTGMITACGHCTNEYAVRVFVTTQVKASKLDWTPISEEITDEYE